MSTSRNGSDPGHEDSTHIDDLPGFGEDEDSTTSTAPSGELAEDERYAQDDDLYDDELLDFGLDELDEDVATHTAPGRPDDPRH